MSDASSNQPRNRPYPDPATGYVPPPRPAYIAPLLPGPSARVEQIPARRPFVVNLRDWLSCVVLFFIASAMITGTALALLGALAIGNAINEVSNPAQQPSINWEYTPEPCVGEVPC